MKWIESFKSERVPDGDITHVKMDSGKAVSIEQAIRMAKENQVENVIVGKARDGSETLRSRGNDTEEDNLSNLPLF